MYEKTYETPKSVLNVPDKSMNILEIHTLFCMQKVDASLSHLLYGYICYFRNNEFHAYEARYSMYMQSFL